MLCPFFFFSLSPSLSHSFLSLKNTEGKSVDSLSLSSLFSLTKSPPPSLLKGSILRKHTEAYRGKGGTQRKHTEVREAHRRKGSTQTEAYRGKGSRIVTVVMKQGSTNQVTDPPVLCLLPLPPV